MTLQPYDGATRVLLPDGRQCWEKETPHFHGSEPDYSYQYSVEIDNLSTDYYGRVSNLKVLAPDGTWNEVVTFLPVSPNLVKRLRDVLALGWEKFTEGPTQGLPEDGSSNRLYADGYLRIAEDVVALLQSGVKKS